MNVNAGGIDTSDTIDPTTAKIMERVRAGMDWLLSDEAAERGFNVDRVEWGNSLDMAGAYSCVLGQSSPPGVDGWYRVLVAATGGEDADYAPVMDAEERTEWALVHGFLHPAMDDEERVEYTWTDLEDAWRAEASARGITTG